MKKKSNKPTFAESDNGKKIRLCQEKGCLNEGEYEAPKSPNSKEKYFFCLHHIKIYNKRWNYFAGKSQKQIYDFQKMISSKAGQQDHFLMDIVQKLNLNLNTA